MLDININKGKENRRQQITIISEILVIEFTLLVIDFIDSKYKLVIPAKLFLL